MTKNKGFLKTSLLALTIAASTLSIGSINTLDVQAASTPTKEFYDSVSNATNIPVINFHRISNDLDKYPDVKKITVDTKKFEQILIRLKSEGYTTVSQEQFIEFYKGKDRVPAKSVLLTIDDGFEDVYTDAYPLLKKYNMKAVIFPITSDVDGGTRFNAPMMTYAQMKEMVDSGLVEIGNHTDDLHWRGNGYTAGFEAMIFNKDKNNLAITNRYEYIKNDALKAESKLLKGTGVKVDSISYPFGAYDATAISVYKDLGYRVGYTVDAGLNMLGGGADNPFEAKRFIGVTYNSKVDGIITSLNNYQTEAKAFNNANKDIKTTTSSYNALTGQYVQVQLLSDMKLKKNTVKSISVEIYKNNGGKRTFIAKSPMSSKTSKGYSSIQFYENFKTATYSEAGNYSMKVIVTRNNGSREIEWINYNVKK